MSSLHWHVWLWALVVQFLTPFLRSGSARKFREVRFCAQPCLERLIRFASDTHSDVGAPAVHMSPKLKEAQLAKRCSKGLPEGAKNMPKDGQVQADHVGA